MAEAWKKIGSVRKGKNGGNYIKLDGPVTLAADDVIQLQDPRKKLQESAAAGRITQDQADEWGAKIPPYVKYDLVLPPRK